METFSERTKHCKNMAERIQVGIQTPGDYMEYLSDCAKDWIPESIADINRNYYMTKCNSVVNQSNQDVIDAAITVFLNHVGASFCMDYGFYTRDLREDRVPLGEIKFGEDLWKPRSK